MTERLNAAWDRYPVLATAITPVLLTVILVSGLVAWTTFGFDWGRSDGDPWNYLAAGERLNAGHPLYALSPGDRPVVIAPPYWTVPLLAPPPIAVFWRPLAAFGPASMYLWGAAGLIAILASGWFLWRRGALLLVAVLALDLWLTALSGNASGLVIAMLIGAWVLRDRPWAVGALIACAAAIKVLPILLILWLAATGRWRAVGATVVVGAAIFGISLVGAGPAAFGDWLASAASAAPSPSALASRYGIATWMVVVINAVPIVVLGGRDRWSFGAAIVAIAMGTPAFYFSAWALLAALPVWRDQRPEIMPSPRPAMASRWLADV